MSKICVNLLSDTVSLGDTVSLCDTVLLGDTVAGLHCVAG